MQAVILAAGMGRRLGKYTGDNTKCMVEVNGVKLIDRALSSLEKVGVSRIVLVVGYKGDNVRGYIGDSYHGIPVIYVENPIYDKTNNIYSLSLAREALVREDTLLLESDLIFDDSVISRLVNEDYPNVVLVDKFESWMNGTVVTMDAQGRITDFVDKDDFDFSKADSYYKTVNIYKFSKDFLIRYYLPFLDAYCISQGRNEYYEQVLKVIVNLRDAPLKAVALGGENWYEIDDIQDLDIAEGMFADSDEEHYMAYICRFGGYWRYPKMLDYCYLVNPYFPSKRLLDEMRASFDKLVREYPSGMKVNALLAEKNFGIPSDYLVVGNGAAELIKSFVENYCGVLGNILPTFEEYPNRLPSEKLIQFVPDAVDYHYTADDVMRFYEDKPIDSLLVINPDNPSGNFIPHQDMLALLRWSAGRGIRLVVDESFLDFSDENISLITEDTLKAFPNLFVIKSISKSYGVPGLRLGLLASGDRAVIAQMKKDVAIWNVNSFGEFFLQIFDRYRSDFNASCRRLREDRAVFVDALKRIPWLSVFPSQANFVLCEVKGMKSREVAMKLLKKNILVKDCNGKAAMKGRNLMRLAVRSRQDNERLINELTSLQ